MHRTIFPTSGDFRVDPSLVFVAMPFSGDFDQFYEAVESLVIGHCHLRCLRADNIFESGRITTDIWRYVNEAMLIIADLSGRNANVFYEVGLAHALGRPVVLLARDPQDIPFDLRELRVVGYDQSAGFKALKPKLLSAIHGSVVTIPERWGRPHEDTDGRSQAVRISGLQQPQSVGVGQPFEIVIRARNEGNFAREGYVSVSFPEGVEEQDVEVIQTDVKHQIGRVKQPWSDGRVILAYPIAEAFAAPWESGKEHFMKVQVRSRRRGWLPYYVSASSSDAAGDWSFDPVSSLHVDQRRENVLCGVVDVTE